MKNKIIIFLILSIIHIEVASSQLLNPIPIAVYQLDNEVFAVNEYNKILYSSKDIIGIEQYSEDLLGCYILERKQTFSAYIDNFGKVMIKTCSYKTYPFQEGRTFVLQINNIKKEDFAYGCIDKYGRFIVPMEYLDFEPFSEGLAYIMNKTECGYIDTNGKFVFKFEKGIAGYGFSEGLSPVSDSRINRFGYVDRNGKVVIDYKFDEAECFSNGLAKVFFRNIQFGKGAFGYINKSGLLVINNEFESATNFKEDRAFVGFLDSAGENLVMALINTDGIPLSNYKFRGCKDFSEGVCAVQDGEYRWRYIDTDAHYIDSNYYQYCGSFKNNKAFVITSEGQKKIIDKTGKTVIEIPKNADIVLDCRTNEKWEAIKKNTK